MEKINVAYIGTIKRTPIIQATLFPTSSSFKLYNIKAEFLKENRRGTNYFLHP